MTLTVIKYHSILTFNVAFKKCNQLFHSVYKLTFFYLLFFLLNNFFFFFFFFLKKNLAKKIP